MSTPRPTRPVVPVLLTLALVGCYKVDTPPFEAPIDAEPIDALPDAAPPDAETGCTPNAIVCDDVTDRYTECSDEGVVTFVLDCPLGCADDVEKCLDVDPSNGVAQYLDQARTDPEAPELTLGDGSSIDTTTGVVFNGAVSVEVPNAVVNENRVFMFKSLNVTGTLRVTGGDTNNYRLVIVADGDVTITGVLDVSSDAGGPRGPGGASAGGQTGYPVVSPGGGGGGHFQSGASGGAAGDGTPGVGGNASTGSASLDPLTTGRGGLSIVEQNDICASGGGGSGGAVQITSRTRISITGSGMIDASGAGGESMSPEAGECAGIGGGGGGSGGAVLLEAPQIVLDGTGVVVSTKGGAGAAAGAACASCNGADGGTGPAAASGGTNGSLAAGGAGGTDSAPPEPGDAGGSSTADGGGGGGSVGRARFNTLAGSVNPQNGAAIRSRYTTEVIGTRLLP